MIKFIYSIGRMFIAWSLALATVKLGWVNPSLELIFSSLVLALVFIALGVWLDKDAS